MYEEQVVDVGDGATGRRAPHGVVFHDERAPPYSRSELRDVEDGAAGRRSPHGAAFHGEQRRLSGRIDTLRRSVLLLSSGHRSEIAGSSIKSEVYPEKMGCGRKWVTDRSGIFAFSLQSRKYID